MKDSPHFEKTRFDILQLRRCGVEVPEALEAWVKRRSAEYAHASPKLAQPKKTFFTDNVPYVYVHDTIHLAVASGTRPAYKEFQRDGAEVMVDREKWERLPEEVKLNSVVEEAAVLALERHQIPNDFKPLRGVSFNMALQKVCTSISSGWWREWAWEHYDQARAVGETWDYVAAFRAGLQAGVVLPHRAGE